MQKRQSKQSSAALVLIAVAALILAVLSTQVRGQGGVICPTTSTRDFDNDGLTDQEECNGITLTAVDGRTLFIPPCSVGMARASCFDPNSPDLVVTLLRANPSKLPGNPLEFISKPINQGGLGIATHEITLDLPERSVTPRQKAIKIVESLNTNGPEFGIAYHGTPCTLRPGFDVATIFSQRIENFVTSVYTNAGDRDTTKRDNDIITYKKHTTVHEAAHMLFRTDEYIEKFGGWHYKAGTIVVPEQSVVYTTKRGTVTFYISTNFALPDQTGVNLSEGCGPIIP